MKMNLRVTKEFISKESFSKNLPFPLFAKGRWGGIL
jgi:hypothetical protein